MEAYRLRLGSVGIASLFVILLSTAQAAGGCVPTTSTTNEGTLVVDARPSGETTSFLAADYYVWDHGLCDDAPTLTDGGTIVVHDSSGDEAARVPVPVGVVLADCAISAWEYYESNGIDGLQRVDEVHDDTCGGVIDGDTIPF